MTRPRVGVLVPSSDTTLERELPALFGGRAEMFVTRMYIPEVTPAGLATMEEHALDAAALLADVAPDVLLFGCTSGSFFRGAKHEQRLAQRLSERANAPVVTTAWAVARALAQRGLNVRVRTPYTDELTKAECQYLVAKGLTIASARGLGLTRDKDIALVAGDEILALADGDDSADVLLLSCTNLPSADALAAVQASCHMPVVTSNTASAEMVLQVLDGVTTPTGTHRSAGKD